MKDTIKNERVGSVNLPKLHGHTKITLTDIKTGEKEVVEKDNLVTDAVANIFAANLFGALDYSKLTPIRDMFGGVLCFESALTEDATNTLPPCDDDNRLIAHAGQTSHSSESVLRGNPNGVLSEVIQSGKGYKFVWDFSTSQGNGTISAVSLTNKDGGDTGLRPIEKVSPLITPNSNKTKSLKSGVNIDFSTYYQALVKVDIANNTGIHVCFPTRSTSTLIVNEVEVSIVSQGINEELGDGVLSDSHEVTLTRTFDSRYTGVCCDDDYIYVVEPDSNGGSTLYINKISLSDFTVSSADITDASLSLLKQEPFRNYDFAFANKTCVSNDYIYWAKSDRYGYYKLNLTNAADIVEISSELEEYINDDFGLVEISDGLVLGKNFIINDKVYPMESVKPSLLIGGLNDYVTPFIRYVKDGGLYYVWGYLKDTSYAMNFFAGVGVPLCYLATIQNLDSPITKTADKTMQIEYSITIEE